MSTTLTSIVFTTRARSTGASVAAGRTDSGSWGALCLSHGALTERSSRVKVELATSHPQGWCEGCADIAAGRRPKVPQEARIVIDLRDRRSSDRRMSFA